MKPSETQPKSGAKWFWIVILVALLILSIAWFASPLGKIEGSPKPEPTANPTEWTPAPTTPAVEVNLPQTPLKNSKNDAPDGAND